MAADLREARFGSISLSGELSFQIIWASSTR